MTKHWINPLYTLAILFFLASGAWAVPIPPVDSPEFIVDPNKNSIDLPSILEEEKILAEPFKKNENLTDEENGFLAMKMGDLSAAKEAFQKSVKEKPKNVRVLLALGQIALHEKQPKFVEQYLKRALKIQPKNGAILQTLGRFHASQNRFNEAENAFNEAIRNSPSNPWPHVDLAKLHLHRKHAAKAQQAFETAIQVDSTFTPGYLGLGDTLVLQDEHQKALEAYETASEISPGLALPYVKMGQTHELRHDMAQTEQAYRKALELDPHQLTALNNLAWISAEKRTNLDEALKWAQQAVSLLPNDPNSYDTLGWVQRARGELKEAQASFIKGTTLPPLSPAVMYHLGIVQSEQGNPAKAVVALKNALDLDPNFPHAQDAKSRLDKLTNH